jgi:hypothetical protein
LTFAPSFGVMAIANTAEPASHPVQVAEDNRVPFPLLVDPNYEPNTFDYYTSDPELPHMKQWIGVTRSSIAGFQKTAANDKSVENAKEKAAKFAEKCDALSSSHSRATLMCPQHPCQGYPA